MKSRCTIILVISLTLLLTSYEAAYGQNLIEYTIQVNSDGSASWIIKQTGTNITVSPEMLVDLRDKVTSLVEAAENRTGRDMAANEDTMSVTSTFLGSYVTVEYRFYWTNFSEVESAGITIGDVFRVQGFFLQLYGEGKVYLTYPSGYAVESVSPPPYKRDDSLQRLEWPGTEDFNNGWVNIALREQSESSGFLEVLGQNVVPIVSLALLASGFSAIFYMFRRGKKKESGIVKTPGLPSPLGAESDEEKTLRLLRSSGGSLYQSAITEHCGFSRAKTSQLLAALESRGVVRRHKRGRDKIVTLIEQDKK